MNLLLDTVMPDRVPRKLCGLALVVVGLALWSGCDRFLVSPCVLQSELAGCPVGHPELAVDGGSAELNNDMDEKFQDMAGLTVAPRSFEWRTKVELRDNGASGLKRSFVGCFADSGVGRHFLFLSRTNWLPWFKFDRITLDLSKKNEKDRWASADCMNCPSIPSVIDFESDRIVVSGGEFWHFRYGFDRKIHNLMGNRSVELADVELPKQASPRLFVHPDLRAFSVAAINKTDNSNVTLTSIQGQAVMERQPVGASRTAYVVGDLDGSGNGYEIINFSGNGIGYLWHTIDASSGVNPDLFLMSELEKAISNTKGDDETKIEAAYVADLNQDGHKEFIYSRSGNIYVTSYMGGDAKSGYAVFKNWSKAAVVFSPRELVNSIMAVDITNDGFPDLIVETNLAVHFYLNTP